MTTLSFPGGAGGNWIKKILFDDAFDYNTNEGHFHAGTDILYPAIELSHDTAQFDILLNGNCCLNIALNMAVKFHMIQARSYVTASWGEAVATVLDCVNSTVHKYSEFSATEPDLDYKSLFVYPDVFLEQIHTVQTKLGLPKIDREKFLEQRQKYVDSCVCSVDIIQNWENEFWVIYILGDLQQQGICPEFTIFDRNNWSETVAWAQDNYVHCRYPNSAIYVNTPIKINTIDDLTNYS